MLGLSLDGAGIEPEDTGFLVGSLLVVYKS